MVPIRSIQGGAGGSEAFNCVPTANLSGESRACHSDPPDSGAGAWPARGSDLLLGAHPAWDLDRSKAKSAQGKALWGEMRGKPGTSFQEFSPSGVSMPKVFIRG